MSEGAIDGGAVNRLIEVIADQHCRDRAEHPVPGLQTRVARAGVQKILEDLHAERISLSEQDVGQLKE
ncbi:MAG: hypothetical protein PHO20_00995 [Candidatus Peribacteraceae bacterium]|nr:hypothetical protein [Candidatus Peribacteraceae bacterium]MDD5739327.1 hypothetical protein [Candidatus Peribacteraceae bacterium]